jgi:hypothetical protein
MQNLIHRILLLTISASALAGCQYDRSFMQMDSKSGAPFLGLQWSVDSGSRPNNSQQHESESVSPLALDLPEGTIAGPAKFQTVSAHSTSMLSLFEPGNFFRNRQDQSDANAVDLRLSEF